MGALMNLNFGRCQLYKLNISTCLTEREQDYYNLFCDGISAKKLKERLGGQDFYTPEMIAETFHITVEQAIELLEGQLHKQFFREYLVNEIKKFSKVREVRKSAIYIVDDKGKITDTKRTGNKIVWFENECVRRCNADLSDVPLLDQFLILKCGSEVLTDVLEQIIKHGVDMDGKHYVFYTSSTGQMKDTEITLLEENYWNKNKLSLMCGLTEECINAKGGINMGKFLSAKALNISNSKKIHTDIDINDVIIVPDFMTKVKGRVNFLDVDSLEIQQLEKEIEIEHMDGAGLFIPGVLPCSCQIRGGFLKGAVFPFDFHKFIRMFNDKLSDRHMVDAWGNPVSIDDFLNAKMILTDSQLKMRKYYNSMEEYRKCFEESGMSITINNCAHEPKDEVRVAYQPFQTIPRENLTYESVENVTQKTIDYINDAKTDPKIALKLMGIELESCEIEKEDDSVGSQEMQYTNVLSPLHAAILKYPKMLNDIHVQKIMKSAMLASRKQAQGCKLILDGTWSYICPDLFAFCEWLFLGENIPKGLIPEGYIFNHYYDDKPNIEESCCLRYPHLSDCEHAVRNVLQSEECQKWFIGCDTIVSSHDLISKAIQADWDGDHICLVHDKTFLNLLNKTQYPLYYDMTKAEPALISTEAIMTCLTSSFFDNENIGYVSNSITKIFNSIDEPDIKMVRILCAFNNFVIDYFKTQKSMDLKEYKKVYEKYKDKKSKCPWFFQYAKGKKLKSCEAFNINGNCDWIGKYVGAHTSNGISKVDYSTDEQFNSEVLSDKNIKVERQSNEYKNLRILLMQLKNERQEIYKKVKSDLDAKESCEQIFNIYCMAKIKEVILDRKEAANYLVDIEYHTDENKNDKKDILWNCFGDILYQNLCENVDNNVNISVRRDFYISSDKKEKDIMESRDKVIEEQKELKSVPITKDVYDYLMNTYTHGSRRNDKYIMYLLYVFIERFKKKYENPDADYIRIYHGTKKKNKITCATIDNLIDSACTKKGLDKLQEKGYIDIEALETYDKVYLKNVPSGEGSKVLFNAVSGNPLYDLWEYNKDRKIKYCEICHKKYVATGNAKTCPSEKCSLLLRKTNKNKKK